MGPLLYRLPRTYSDYDLVFITGLYLEGVQHFYQHKSTRQRWVFPQKSGTGMGKVLRKGIPNIS